MNTYDQKQVSERLATFAAIAYPLAAIPQAVEIFSNQNAESLSLVSWISFLIVEAIFFWYGINYKLRPIIVTGVLWIAVYIIIIMGIILYG